MFFLTHAKAAGGLWFVFEIFVQLLLYWVEWCYYEAAAIWPAEISDVADKEWSEWSGAAE